MKIEPYIPKEWDIPKEDENKLFEKKVERILTFLNRTNKGSYCMMNYEKQKIITGISSISTIGGYSKEFVKKAGLKFYFEILDENEQKWLTLLNMEAQKVLYQYSESDRLNLEFNYDLIAKKITGEKILVHHRLIPYELCNNGNMWLALCCVTEKPLLLKAVRATIVHINTGRKHEYIDNTFVKSPNNDLTEEEIEILKCLAKGMQLKQISDSLKIPQRSVERKGKNILDKLDVLTYPAATCKAVEIGLI
jgi:DNA-binding CsgD family transcriptional regulator